ASECVAHKTELLQSVQLTQLPVLEELNLVRNKVECGIPKELGKLEAVKKLSLSGNPLGGVIPPDLRGLNALEELTLLPAPQPSLNLSHFSTQTKPTPSPPF
ncbi:unnamed protein product, partial [Laminaria digitata]